MSQKSSIILNYQELKPIIKKYREQKKKIVLTQGTFDMLHIGHGRYLEKAKNQGDILLVGVDSDQKVKARKGPNRPVVPEKERLEMLSYMSSVDHAILKPLGVKRWRLIEIIKPDVLVATESTYSKSEIKDLEKICGKVVVFQAQATTSTSAKLRRLQIGFAQDFSETLTEKIQQAINQITSELMKKPEKK